MLTKRQQQLLKLLERTSGYQSIENLAKKLKVSPRTIYADISQMKDANIPIITKRGLGIALQLMESTQLPDEILSNRTMDRRIDIMKRLLMNNETITLSRLSTDYFVSQSSIQYDLTFIEKVLSDSKETIYITNRTGTALKQVNTIKRVYQLNSFNRFILENKRFDDKGSDKFSLLAQYYPEEVVAACSNICYSFVRSNLHTISEVYVEGFLSSFIAFVSLLIQDAHIENEGTLLQQREHAVYMSSAVTLLHKVSLRLKFQYTNGDVLYLSQLLLNYRFEQMPDEKVDECFVSQIIIQVGQALNMDFTTDSRLNTQLKTHLPAMMERLKHKNFAKNPFTEQIKLEFSIIFNVVWIVMESIGQEFNVPFTEDEIAFLAIYFQLAIERAGMNRRILVVCQTGIVTSELLIHRIKSVIPSMDNLEVASLYEVDDIDLDDYDLVLTTVNFKRPSKKVRYISPLISNDDIVVLLNNGYHRKENKDQRITFHPHIDFLMLEDVASREGVLKHLSHHIFENGWVDNLFYDSLVSREKIGNTEFPGGIALPHGNPSFVRESFISVVKLEKKIKWQNSFIDTIILIGISKLDIKHTKSVVARVYQMISEETLVEKLKGVTSQEEVENVFYGR